jgi:16S rRNA processing protein RimM
MPPKGKSSSPSPASPEKRVCVAKIGAPHGVRGEVRLHAFTADPLALADYGLLESADGAQKFEIVALRPQKDFLVARLKGIDDRDAAEKLRHVELYVPRERLPEPEADEFYHADLIGLRAEDASGAPLGTVVAVHNFGAGDILEIAPATGGPTAMLPFTQSVVPVVDLAGGRVVIEAEDWLTPSP